MGVKKTNKQANQQTAKPTKETYEEVSEFVKAACMSDPYEAHGCGP